MLTMKQERKAVERREQERCQAVAQAKFTAELPLKLLQLMARAQQFATCCVKPRAEGLEFGGFVVHFLLGESGLDNCELSLQSEEWELTSLTEALDNLEAAKVARVAKRKLGAETWDTLTPEQREALGLSKHRPNL